MTSQGRVVHDEAVRDHAAEPLHAAADHAARNRRLGWILFGIFAALAALSIIFIDLRSVGR